MSKPEILFEFKYRDEIIQFCADQNFYGPGSDIADDGKIVRWASREAFWIEVANHYRAQLAQAKKELEEARAARREGTDIEPIVSESEYCWRIFVARKNATTWKKVSRQNQPAVRAAHGAERGREGS